MHYIHLALGHVQQRVARPHDFRANMLRHNLQLAVRISHVAHRVAPHPHTPQHIDIRSPRATTRAATQLAYDMRLFGFAGEAVEAGKPPAASLIGKGTAAELPPA